MIFCCDINLFNFLEFWRKLKTICMYNIDYAKVLKMDYKGKEIKRSFELSRESIWKSISIGRRVLLGLYRTFKEVSCRFLLLSYFRYIPGSLQLIFAESLLILIFITFKEEKIMDRALRLSWNFSPCLEIYFYSVAKLSHRCIFFCRK